MAKTRKARLPRLPLPDLTSPPEIRLANATAMRSSWIDPEDLRPNARRAREIAGYRAYCPIRKALHQHSDRSQFSDLHVLAADRLRLDADAVAIGLSNGQDMSAAQAWAYGPITGPSALAIARAWAWPRFRRAMALFNAEEKGMITAVILLNHSLRSWSAEQREKGQRWSSSRATTKLVELLDRLVAHYDWDDRDSRSAA